MTPPGVCSYINLGLQNFYPTLSKLCFILEIVSATKNPALRVSSTLFYFPAKETAKLNV
jgi:hypothetical protein